MSYDWSSKIREMDDDGSKLPFDVKFRIRGPGIFPASLALRDGVVEAHRFVATAVSPVFQALLSQNWSEGKNHEIEIQQVCPEAFKTLIRFIYNPDGMNFDHLNDVGTLIELYHVSNQYEIRECKKKLLERCSSLKLDRTTFGQILSLLGKL